MLLLPAFHARLLPCSESWDALTPQAQGRHCARCQRVVHDFSQSTNPTADLAAARAAAPDGRVCGHFAGAQVQPPPPLTRRLRWFVVALVLVVAQGLSAQEALAQVRQGARGKAVKSAELLGDAKELPNRKQPSEPSSTDLEELQPKQYAADGQVYTMGEITEPVPRNYPRHYIEQMPTFKKQGFNSGSSGIVDYIQRNIQYQPNFPDGKVFVTFTVDTAGLVQQPIVVKGLSPAADAEVLRVIKAMDGFTPGMSRGRPVAIPYTLPITFKNPSLPPHNPAPSPGP
ncbi:energy transducer TonB [Hymenobacter caeli]|uniref:Protein TonB n=1 Tax=Hymenobacter caeli TaxID=2735894 RepID=A0ABX2FQB2_9BACT|nr:energy transducer TonB [Hymenobacter caeli]NRT18620.1 protein TonB [Hymenobacter caeli]